MDTDIKPSGRPRKYKTPEEREEKYREVRRKYYALHAEEINEKRRENRKKHQTQIQNKL
jgi:hypothetical protein